MPESMRTFSQKQLVFKELFVGTLIYVTILGLFNDYTSIVYAESFSTIFFAAIVLEVLTYLAFLLKHKVITLLKDRTGTIYRVMMFFCVWLILFFSKFIFIWAIDIVFGGDINIHGFFGIFVVVACVTVLHKLADMAFKTLGDA